MKAIEKIESEAIVRNGGFLKWAEVLEISALREKAKFLGSETYGTKNQVTRKIYEIPAGATAKELKNNVTKKIKSMETTNYFEARELARKMNIKGWNKMKKEELFNELKKVNKKDETVNGYSVGQKILFVRKENIGIGIRTTDDLMKDGYLFGIRQNFHYSDEFNKRLVSDENFKKHFEAVSQTDLNLKKVKAGHLTGCFGDSILTGYQVQTDKAFEDLRVVSVPFFQPDPVYFGVSKKISKDKLEKL